MVCTASHVDVLLSVDGLRGKNDVSANGAGGSVKLRNFVRWDCFDDRGHGFPVPISVPECIAGQMELANGGFMEKIRPGAFNGQVEHPATRQWLAPYGLVVAP